MDKKYEDWNKLFCDELCEEISKFECTHKREYLCGIKELIEVINGLQEMEMDGAIRRIAEDHYGYDSGTGRFRRDGMERFGRDAEMEFIEMFNAARGRGRGRRRDSRGRFISNMVDPRYMPPYYPGVDEGDYPWEHPYYMMNDGKREFSGDRFESEEDRERMKEEREEMMNAGRGGRGRNRGGSRGGNRSDGRSSGGRGGRSGGSYNAYPNGQYDDDGMYMLRQENGMPIMTPYNAHDPHDIPKKLTKQQYEEWMRGLVNVDGSQGPHWTIEQTKQIQQKKGLTEVNPELFNAAMNASYSDLCEFFQKHGLNQPEIYAEYVEAFWLDDEDAIGSGDDDGAAKMAAYFTTIVEH